MAETNLIQMFLKWEQETPQQIFLRQPVAGKWITWSYKQAGDEIRRIATALTAMTLPPRSNIAILSKNCAHWIMADLAILIADHVSVPFYSNGSAASIKQILEHSNTQAIFVGKLDDYENQKKGIPDFTKKIALDFYNITEDLTWSDLLAKHEPLKQIVQRSSEELLTIMYTSGTTGIPKGVMFNARAFDHVTKILLQYLDDYGKIPPHPELFSYLPLCHIAERNLTEMLACYSGASISFVESLDTFARDVASVQPHLFFGVPRIWARLQEKILEKMPQQKLDKLLKIPVVRTIVKNKIKKSLGVSRAGLKGTGAAPIPAALLQWFENLGITVREIYGMTENCALSHANQRIPRFGSAGQVMTSVDAKFSDAGELLIKHNALMMGYNNEPELTKEVFTSDGFLKTGDQGTVDAEGYLTLTGRMNDLFKTDKAKYISPSGIEMKLQANTDIEQVCVVGVGLPQPIALVTLSQLGKAKSREKVNESLTSLLRDVNSTLEDYEKIKKAIIMQDDWTIDNGLMTPTLKVKRNQVEKLFMPRYKEWYKRDGVVVWNENM